MGGWMGGWVRFRCAVLCCAVSCILDADPGVNWGRYRGGMEMGLGMDMYGSGWIVTVEGTFV